MALPIIMTPGTYLAKRRDAAGLSIALVAELVTATPAMALRDRIQWLQRIEADVNRPSEDVIAALHAVFPFDVRILATLIDLHDRGDEGVEAPHLCRVCACSWHDACVDHRGRGCSWAEKDLCSNPDCLVTAANSVDRQRQAHAA